jgi:hypothetical protein
MILAIRSPADESRVAVTQLMRLLVLTALLPSLLEATSSNGIAAAAALPVTEVRGLELALCLLAAGTLGLLCERWRVPAGMLIGSMIASGLIHGSGLSAARIPASWLIPGYIVTGSFIGARFTGLGFALILRTMAAGLVTVAIALTIAGTFALAAARLLRLPLDQVWLAYAPGGVEVMAILALALQLDPAYVGAHHVLRFTALSLLVPLWLRRHPD